MPRVVINGRFLSQSITGVQRFAREATRAIDALIADGDSAVRGWEFELVAPPNATLDLPLRHVPVRRAGRALRGQLWEQAVLPRRVGGDLLLNLANTAPLAITRQLVVMHDASVWAIPETFTRAFRAWYRVLLPALGRRSLRVGTVSEFSRAELVARAHIPAGKLVVAPGGADHILRTPPDHRALDRFALPPGRFVLAVSSDAPHKQFPLIERAMNDPRCAHLGLVIVGSAGGTTLVSGSRVAGGRGLRVGRVSDAELRALYERALCLAFPSTYEGFGLPPLEAMASGCPVIVSHAAALREVCGSAALYCVAERPDELAERIAALDADASLRAAAIERGRERAGRFTWRETARALVRGLEAPTDARGRRA